MNSESNIPASIVIIAITLIMSMFVFTCHKTSAKPMPAFRDTALMKEFLGK